MGSEPNSPSSLKQLIKHSLCIPCCFRKHHNHHQSFNSNDDDDKPRLTRTTSSTQKSRPAHYHQHQHHNRNHHETLPEFKEKCKNFISRIGGGGGGGGGRHSRRHSADFRYDALSYALNFDDGGVGVGGGDDAHSDECPLRSFSSRLPPSPNREITAM